ncbi:MFS transporter [Streptomyces sp. AS02]|uniref:MFS transporter n=1 Tax=Streptomyces sp. AS02 TaxID=2938946 RepID=UPI002021681B|nr:MFS transporter [Streptomyces sp. AS02]MCL8010676.1 MFS transporter [Streptomyces sp. AS02]
MTGDRQRRAAAVVVCLGLFLLGMDLTVLNVAVPDLQRDLNPSMAQVQWIVDAYALVLGGLVLTAGALTDRIGRRRAFMTGLAVCGAASAFGALAEEPGPVVAARCGMGAGAALLMPATLSIISNLFTEPAARRRAIALWAAVLGLGGMTGPVLGGALVEGFSWRAGFWVNVPLVAVTLVLTLRVVPATGSGPTPRHGGERVDLPGAVLSACGLLTFVWAVIESPAQGWTSTPVLSGFALATALLTAFVVHERRRAEAAMLPLSLLRLPGVVRGAVSLALLSFALYGALFVITLYLQGVLGYTPWQAGVRTLPLAAALAAGSLATPSLMARHGARKPIAAGLALVTVAFAVLAHTGAASGYGRLMVFEVVAGLGAGLVAAAGTEAVMGAVPLSRAGLGSAVNDATRQVGAALGVAVQGSVLSTVITDRLGAAVSAAGPTAVLAPSPAARQAFVDGLTATALTAGAVTLAATLAVIPWRGVLPHGTTSREGL